MTLVGSALIISGSAGAAPTTIDFESSSTSQPLTTQLAGQGVTFPQGLEVYNCSPTSCIAARSGAKVVRGQAAGEFARDPFEAVFTDLQKTASLWVRSDVQFSPPKTIMATVNAYNAAGNPVGSQTKTFSSGATWQQLSVGSLAGSANIKRIVVSGGQDDTAITNFLSYDDLSFDPGDDPEPSPSPTPVDDEEPFLVIHHPPPGTLVTEQNVMVEVDTQDESGLFTVDGNITGPAGEAAQIDFCGSSFSGSCPLTTSLHTFGQSVSLPGAPNGTYTVSITACDPVGNCATRTRVFILDVEPIPEVTDVVPSRVEVSQGIQTRLSGLTGPGTASTLSTGVQLMSGKDTLVRWYLFGDGGTRSDFAGRMQVTVFNRDDSIAGRTTLPNAGVPDVDLVPEPASADLLQELAVMRADLTRTLNFVIPGTFTGNASRLEVRLRDGASTITSRIQTPLGRSRVGLNVIRIGGSAVDTAPPSLATIEANIHPYLRQTYPTSEVRTLSTRTLLTSDEIFGVSTFAGECGFVLWQLDSAFGGDDTPVRSFTTDRNIIISLGVLGPNAVDDALGCAYVEDADDDYYRRGGPAVTEAFGDTAGQEIAHVLGLIHASDSHGESDGGDAETGWPHPHGTTGEDAFGAIIQTSVPPGGTDFGTWTVRLVDPCPVTDIASRFPTCTLAGSDPARPHDFMSYGTSTTNLSPFVTSKQRWISQTTYSRLYAAISLRSSPVYPRSSGVVGDDDRQDSMILQAFIADDGSVSLLPVMHKMLPKSAANPGPVGDYRIRAFDSLGQTLLDRSVAPVEITEHDSETHLLRAVAPFMPGMSRVTIERNGAEVLEETASDASPVVSITSPTGGETFPGGNLAVRWAASDADGDDLVHLVQFSPDGGSSWQGLQLVGSDDPLEAVIDVSELIEGRHGLVRIVSSDGFNTGEDQTEVFFSVGTEDPPATDNKVGRKLSLKIKAGTRKAIGKLRSPDGPFSCIEDMRVVLTRNGKKIGKKDTNLFGKVTFKLRKRPGRYGLIAKKTPAALLVCKRARSPVKRFKL